ncbi:MAG: NUDIX domain-containing protein [Acholeplasmataceae bacterium]|nr:NUDIX domain-containing protein [Acholeplasmataceae bacterium]
MITEKSCGGVVFRSFDSIRQYLLVHMLSGHWSFPKGHMETGESEKETAMREIKEETNLDVDIFPGFRESITYSPRSFVVKEVVYFLCRPIIADVIPQFEEIQGAKWFNFNEALNQLTYQKDRNILQLAEAFINQIK